MPQLSPIPYMPVFWLWPPSAGCLARAKFGNEGMRLSAGGGSRGDFRGTRSATCKTHSLSPAEGRGCRFAGYGCRKSSTSLSRATVVQFAGWNGHNFADPFRTGELQGAIRPASLNAGLSRAVARRATHGTQHWAPSSTCWFLGLRRRDCDPPLPSRSSRPGAASGATCWGKAGACGATRTRADVDRPRAVRPPAVR